MAESHVGTAVESTVMAKHHQDGAKKDLKTLAEPRKRIPQYFLCSECG